MAPQAYVLDANVEKVGQVMMVGMRMMEGR